MNILDAIQARQSIRSFKNKEVSKEIIENILNISRFAPSGGNTQPWKIYVLNQDLMKELEKLYRIVNKITDQITVIITLDANIGQNGIKQVEEFNKSLPIDGIILNKMDGTAKGGVAISILDKFSFPIVFLGIGEKIDNIVPFDEHKYINSIISFD